jgi:hypothetical protein
MYPLSSPAAALWLKCGPTSSTRNALGDSESAHPIVKPMMATPAKMLVPANGLLNIPISNLLLDVMQVFYLLSQDLRKKAHAA